MPRRRDSYADLAAARAELDNIRSLSGTARAEAAVAALRPGRSPQFVEAVVDLLEGIANPRIQPALVEIYQHFSSSAGRKLDPGAFVRAALVRAMRGRATVDDIPLLEEAAQHHEPGLNTTGGTLRAAALASLDSVDAPAAALWAVELLTDAEEGTGEPALTAVRVLASGGHETALLTVATLMGNSTTAAEAVRHLTGLPPRPLLSLAERLQTADDLLHIGLCDLFVEADAWADLLPALRRLLKHATDEVFAYACAAMVSSRKPGLLELLYEVTAVESRPTYLAAAVDALGYDFSPAGKAAFEAAQARLRKLSS